MSRRRIVFDSGVVATVQRNVRSARRVAVAIAGLAVVGAAGYTTIDHSSTTPSLASIQVEPVEGPSAQSLATAQEVIPPAAELATLHPIPSKKGTPLDELFPSLDGWIHPVVDSDLVLSKLPGGMFGAERGGVMRRECGGYRGGGHCGIDINGPIGRPIVAVAAGTVVHIERSRNGKDGRSGRYVRIEHPDGVMTSYMHLNSIRPGITEGTRVDAGDQVGTLGNTGINAASPHLHFALEIPNVPGTHGDHVNTRYLDPAPFLARATMTETVDRKHPPKPAW
jgi:murein DD-endopeptidase MepM/ murein hydrolase activator NlpD